MPADDQDARVRLGEQLTARRIEIDPRYSDRMVFAVERMGSRSKWRTIYDLEHAKREHFRPDTLRALEGAYHLAPGSLDRFDGELEPLPAGASLIGTGSATISAVPDPPAPGATLSAIDRISALIDKATPAELEIIDATVDGLVAGDEVLELMWSAPSRHRMGELMPREQRLRMILLWLRDDPRRALDEEGRRGTGT